MARITEKMLTSIPATKVELDTENQFVSLSKKELLEKLTIDEFGNFLVDGKIWGVNKTDFDELKKTVEDLKLAINGVEPILA